MKKLLLILSFGISFPIAASQNPKQTRWKYLTSIGAVVHQCTTHEEIVAVSALMELSKRHPEEAAPTSFSGQPNLPQPKMTLPPVDSPDIVQCEFCGLKNPAYIIADWHRRGKGGNPGCAEKTPEQRAKTTKEVLARRNREAKKDPQTAEKMKRRGLLQKFDPKTGMAL